MVTPKLGIQLGMDQPKFGVQFREGLPYVSHSIFSQFISLVGVFQCTLAPMQEKQTKTSSDEFFSIIYCDKPTPLDEVNMRFSNLVHMIGFFLPWISHIVKTAQCK